MNRLDLMKGRQDFPTGEPTLVAAASTTNDTAQIYCIDTGGVYATLDAGMQVVDYEGNRSASTLAGATINGVIYGRWTNVGADVQLLCYPVIVAVTEQ